MSKLDILGIEFIIVSIVLSVMLYKLEISKQIVDEAYEYIKKHRAFGPLTKYLSIISIISIVLIDFVNVNIRMYNFDDVQCTVIPSVAYGFVTGMNLQLC